MITKRPQDTNDVGVVDKRNANAEDPGFLPEDAMVFE
jgi:hypothetical protein